MKQRFIRIASSVAAVLLLAVGLIWLCHADPIEAFGYFCYGLFGSLNGFAEIFVKATPLILMGLGVSISFQTGFFNIGAEGQFYMGALMATFVAIKLPGPPWFRCILAIFVAFIFGGVWAFIPAILKNRFACFRQPGTREYSRDTGCCSYTVHALYRAATRGKGAGCAKIGRSTAQTGAGVSKPGQQSPVVADHLT